MSKKKKHWEKTFMSPWVRNNKWEPDEYGQGGLELVLVSVEHFADQIAPLNLSWVYWKDHFCEMCCSCFSCWKVLSIPLSYSLCKYKRPCCARNQGVGRDRKCGNLGLSYSGWLRKLIYVDSAHKCKHWVYICRDIFIFSCEKSTQFT